MVDFVDNNSDQIVPDFTEFTQLADNNNDDIESFDAIVPEEPHEEVILTPSVENDVPEVSDACHHQNKLAKTRQRKIFDINSLLGKVEEKEKTKILGRALGSHQESFLKTTMNHFRTLIKDGRRSFKSKVEGAQLILKIFSDKIDETDFQSWLANALNL